RFVVCDTGIGIPKEQTEVIFEAFRQADGSTSRRFGGTGLGLAISRDLAVRMGGSLGVESEPGRGSCFTLEIPVDGAPPAAETDPAAATAAAAAPAPARRTAAAVPAAAPAPPQATEAPAPAQDHVADDRHARQRPGRLILAIEDDAGFAQALVELAHELDFDCVVANTAEEGLALASEL